MVPDRWVKRIAVLRARPLGDLLLSVPAFRSLRTGFPEAEITIIGLHGMEPFAQRMGHYIDRFIEADSSDVPDEPPRDDFIAEQRAYAYDLVIQMHDGGEESNALALTLAGRATAGYYRHGAPPGLTLTCPYPVDRPEVLRCLDLVQLLGCPDSGAELEFRPFYEDRMEARRLLNHAFGDRLSTGRATPVIGIHPGSFRLIDRYPAEYFARIADELALRWGTRIVLTGGPDEEGVAQRVARHMQVPVLNLAGQTSLGVLGALLDEMDLFIGNDTGPAHLAEAVGTSTVRIYGPSDPVIWGPLNRINHVVVPPGPPDGSGDQRWTWASPEIVVHLAGDLLSRLMRSRHGVPA